MSPSLANFLFETANFIVLAAALGWVLFRPVRAALDAERERRAAAEKEVAAQREEARKLAAEASEAGAKLDRELQRRRAEALQAAQSEVQRLRDEARQARADQLRAVEEEGAAARRVQASLLAETLGRVAAASLRRLLDACAGPSLDVALVRAASAEIAALPEEARRAAAVESARPLEKEARDLLRPLLGADFEERTVPELGAGVRVTTPHGQVDASALALARQVARQVSEAVGESEGGENG